ncbi:PilZ domain-containing protein [Hahella sp. HN01]|uniref:PilZ domain-containing protein n=1 Tax=Hahella sp. HN01 TaxID=2847262 RepID=UPI001C1EE009|nr:PilZ domain-containing protein [Hahella sp. HN01]MBU6949910.1 PilZ domain-containing protein [Hahella sp. HN01]
MQEVTFSSQSERRIKVRHTTTAMTAMVCLSGLFSRSKTRIVVNCIDFNRYGMAFHSSQKFRLGEKIELCFRGRYIAENGIQAQIVNCREHEHGFRYGIQFAYCASSRDYSREVDNALSRIEGLFSKAQEACRSRAS